MSQSATGGFTPKSINSAGSDNAQVLKSGSGSLGTCSAFNVNAAPRYLKLYDLARVPVPSSDIPVFVVAMPGNSNGAGSNVPFGNITFSNGIAFTIVNGIAVTDDTSVSANDCVISFGYR